MTWVNPMGLGDCWWHVLYLMKIGGGHIFHCRQSMNPWLIDLCANSGIVLKDMNNIPTDARECWIGSPNPSNWHSHNCPNDIIGFLSGTWFPAMGGGSFTRNDLLTPLFHDVVSGPCDLLVIDSLPNSGQCPEFDRVQMDNLTDELSAKHTVVAVNRAFPTLAQLSTLARRAKAIIGVATGPLWPCLQHATLDKQKYILLCPITLQFDSGIPIHHHAHVGGLRQHLNNDGWL